MYVTITVQDWFFFLEEGVRQNIHRLKEAFLERFQRRNLEYSLQNIKQQASEAVDDYINRILAQTADSKVPEAIMVGMMVGGLRPDLVAIVIPQVPKTHQQFLAAATIAEKTVQMTTANPIENLTVQVVNIASMEDRLSAMLTEKLSNNIAEMSALQINSQSNRPYQSQRQPFQQKPQTTYRQQQNYQRPPVSSCQGCVLCIGQQRLRVLGKVCLTIQIKEKCFDFDLHVIDTLPHSLIIGVDFLETNNVTINSSRKSMEISDKCARICSLEINTGLARCIKSCALPANSEIVLPVHVSKRIQAELTLKPKSKLRAFTHENKNVFATNLKELGQATSYKHRIETHDSHPVKMPFYRQPPHLQKEIDRQVQELLDNNIIVPSTSYWFSPVRLVRNRDGSYRFAIDYHKVNKKTKSINFPLPRLEYVFDAIGTAKATMFAVLDLASGYWQIPMDQETRHKAAFIIQSGIYEWLRLPFSLSNSPASFSMVMAQDVQFRWTPQCQMAFDDFKTRLRSSPILAYADMNKPFEIICDASDYAIGHMLTQKDDQNRSRVIAYGGRSLCAAERKYHTTEKECLAIVNAIKNHDTC
ncbi:unnamed protein product [Mytilus coruscus]|uniref:Reverse transcriptase/retrotransposon-derived protein RNase H-like domain-containing protein n=1 Tax=Mytilus coruscus TaxID=42192 RepID=A0A6J8C4J2_MYTCO|nr:unnamed protein product [Mytilus coruscus]